MKTLYSLFINFIYCLKSSMEFMSETIKQTSSEAELCKINSLKHGRWLDKYRSFLQAYKHGKEKKKYFFSSTVYLYLWWRLLISSSLRLISTLAVLISAEIFFLRAWFSFCRMMFYFKYIQRRDQEREGREIKKNPKQANKKKLDWVSKHVVKINARQPLEKVPSYANWQ